MSMPHPVYLGYIRDDRNQRPWECTHISSTYLFSSFAVILCGYYYFCFRYVYKAYKCKEMSYQYVKAAPFVVVYINFGNKEQ